MAGNLGNAFNLILSIHKRPVTIERTGSSEIASGNVPSTSADLTSIIPEMIVYIQGVRFVIPETTVTYTALKDTYIDISTSGVLTYSEVANAAPAPVIATNALRVYKVVADATSITSVVALKMPKSIYAINPTPIFITPSNYSRKLEGPEETVIYGKEYVISKVVLDSVFFPAPKRGDRLKDPEIGVETLSEIKEMFGLGGAIIGWRCRTN